MTDVPQNGWTVNTLYRHLDRLIHESDRRYEERFEGQEKAVQAALASAALAVDRAEQNAEKWRDNANEWRAAMIDREKRFTSQETSDTRFIAMERQVADLKKSRDIGEGRVGGLSAGWGYLIGVVGLVGGIIAIVVSFAR